MGSLHQNQPAGPLHKCTREKLEKAWVSVVSHILLGGRGWVFLFSKENSVRIKDKNLTQAHSELVWIFSERAWVMLASLSFFFFFPFLILNIACGHEWSHKQEALCVSWRQASGREFSSFLQEATSHQLRVSLKTWIWNCLHVCF